MVATLSELSLVVGAPRNDDELRQAARGAARLIADESLDPVTRDQLMSGLALTLARRWTAAGIKRDDVVERLNTFASYCRGWGEAHRKRRAR
jgi:hypothetical protein